MKRILVPTDLSDIAERGLMLAVEIAKRCGAQIYLINFTKHPFGKTFTAMGDVNSKYDEVANLFNIELLQSNRSRLNNLGSYYAEQGVTINTEIVDDEFENGVDEFLKKYRIDMVVMGTSGEETIQEQFTGNHTERIIDISACPVISVRDGFSADDFSNIVLAVDIMQNAGVVYPAIESLRELANCFNATVHLVHVADTSEKMIKDFESYFNRLAQRFLLKKFRVKILKAPDEAAAVMQYAQRVGAGLVAVLKNNKAGIFRIFTSHFSDRIVKEESRPVLTYNLHRAQEEMQH